MDEYEQLQKFFIEKQKENLRLKQEITNLKEGLSDDNCDFSGISDNKKDNKLNKDSDKEKDFSEYESPDKSKPVSPDLNLKREALKKETGSTFFNRDTNPNSSFLSTNDLKHNKNLINNLKNNPTFYRRNSSLVENNMNNTNFLNTNTNTNSKNLNLSKYPSQLLNLKNLASDISSIRPTNTPVQSHLNNHNLNKTQLNANNFANNLESDTNVNNILGKMKSSTNLPNFYRNSLLNNSQIPQKFGENTYVGNFIGFNLAETPIRETITENNNNNISGIKEGKSVYLNLGRLYDEKDGDNRSKSPRLINQHNVSHLSMNKGVIKNIETNITELKTQLNNYEKAYESINTRLDNNLGDNGKNAQLEAKISELNNLLRLKEEEKKHIQELYTNEMKMKLETNNQLILNLKNAQEEEMRNIKTEHESRLMQLHKNFEEEKTELKNTIMNLEKELIITNKKNDLNEKAEIIEFQKKYLTEMRELQKSFEEFKIKTYEEMKILRKQKDEANKKANLYQQNFERIKIEWEQNEGMYRENYRSMKNKLDSFKIFIKNNEILKNQLELSKSEVAFLKLKVSKLENSEKNLHSILLEKSVLNPSLLNNPSFTQTNNFSDGFYSSDTRSNYFTNKSNIDYIGNYDLPAPQFKSNDNPFSPSIGNNQSRRSNSKSISSQQRMIPQGTGGYYSSRDSDLNFIEENTNKIIDLKKAQMKIREMEECLKSMNEENDNLKGKLGNVISNITTPQEQFKSDSNINNYMNNNNNHDDGSRPKVKKKTFSSIINNNTLDDFRSKFKSNSNISMGGNNTNNNSNYPNHHANQYLSHFKSNSMIDNNIHENEYIENNLSDEANDSREDEGNEYVNNQNFNNNYQTHNKNLSSINSINKNEFTNNNNTSAVGVGKKQKDQGSNLLKWNRHLTLGKSSNNNLNPNSSADISSNYINEENQYGILHGNNSNINDGQNVNTMYKINPFVDNTSTFMHNDYENINDKISNLDQIENMDNTNNLEEIEQMDNEEDDSENYGNEFPPLQLRIKNKKKVNKI